MPDLISTATPPIRVQRVQYGFVLLDAHGHHAEHLTLHDYVKHYRSEKRAEQACRRANEILQNGGES